MPTFTTYLRLSIGKTADEIEAEVSFDYTPAERGAREFGTGLALEPDYPERVLITSVVSNGEQIRHALPSSILGELEGEALGLVREGAWQ
jgi:hypothetical protein